MKELFAQIKAIQSRADKRTISKKQVAEAFDSYAKAVSFCDMHELPYRAIRVQVCGGYGFGSNYKAKATFLEYNGETWIAYRARVGGKPNKNQMGYTIRVWVEADEEHKTKLLSLDGHKKADQKLWEADVL